MIRQRCILCAQWQPSGKAIHEHLSRLHHKVWHMPHRPSFESNSPGGYHNNTNRLHSCPAASQLAIVAYLEHHQLRGSDVVDELVALPRPPQRKLAPSTLRAQAGAETPEATFQPARDSANGATQCAHCGTTFNNFYGLRMHVESLACKRFDANRGAGEHVPQQWPWVQQLCASGTPTDWLTDARLREALQQQCSLCGRRYGRTQQGLPSTCTINTLRP